MPNRLVGRPHIRFKERLNLHRGTSPQEWLRRQRRQRFGRAAADPPPHRCFQRTPRGDCQWTTCADYLFKFSLVRSIILFLPLVRSRICPNFCHFPHETWIIVQILSHIGIRI